MGLATAAVQPLRRAHFVCAAALILCLAGCKSKTEAPDNPSAQSPATSAQPAAAAPAQPAAPSRPVPSSSAAQALNLFAAPQKGQTHDQQLIDEADCYDSAQQQSGVNPNMPAPQPPSSAEVQAAQSQAADNAPEAKGGRARGAAKGAVGGAVIGGIAGDAGTGAAVGATVGTVRGGRQQRKANEATKQQAAADAGGQLQQQYQSEKAAYNKQMDTFKRAFSACIDAKGYSVR
jgi:hypothetical protein